MPSPFPGVDPYIEMVQWQSFHTVFMAQMVFALNRDLPAGLYATAESRCYVNAPKRPVVADAAVFRSTMATAPRTGSGGVAVLPRTEAEPTGVVQLWQEEVRERYVAIRTAGSSETVITIIELLSPANKRSGSAGRESYFQKQADVLASDTNLVEIDLLRGGSHTVAVPKEALAGYGAWDFVVCIHRGDKPGNFAFYLSVFREVLPKIRVPLHPDAPELVFDLQALYDYCYDGGRFRDALPYINDVEPPLSTNDTAWSDTLLREAGLR